MSPINYKKYVLVFLITAVIFTTAFSVSNSINNRRMNEIRLTEEKISIGILSLETQFDLLQQTTCDNIDRTTLTQELSTLAEKLTFADNNKEISRAEIEDLKKYYSLLEIKDYLLTKKISEKCTADPVTIVYFYKSDSCPDCQRQGYVLTKIREDNPSVRVYTFDYDIELPAVKTLINIHNIEEDLPAIIVNDKVYQGFQDLETVEATIKPLLPITASTTATTTNN